ncbi:hypothetical protein [Algoriphagus sp. AGSA1]|uniref:hypothetical protein n=1 Tax=Algoriphagus sp. AGSA1 TaxID=2907213 RepID=UPI001F418098|nr:hypothetical protein [Algoriphagus sp. AGSA1]
MTERSVPHWIFTAFLLGVVLGAFILIWAVAGFEVFQLPVLILASFCVYRFSTWLQLKKQALRDLLNYYPRYAKKGGQIFDKLYAAFLE